MDSTVTTGRKPQDAGEVPESLKGMIQEAARRAGPKVAEALSQQSEGLLFRLPEKLRA
jgi:hypothetical protein